MSIVRLSCLLELTKILTLVCATEVFVDDNDTALTYSPSNTWGQGNGCGTCMLQPDTSQTFEGTWHDTVYHAGSVTSTIAFKFTGVGVLAIFVVPDKTHSDASVETNLVFTLDGSQAGTYTHSPSGGADFLYNQTLFEKSGLSNEDHTLVVSATAPDGQSSSVLFDYFIYATDGGTSSSGVSTSSTFSSFSSTAAGASKPSGTSTGNYSSSTTGSSSSSLSSTVTSGTSSSNARSLFGYSCSVTFLAGMSEASHTDVSTDGNTTSITDSSGSPLSLSIAGGVFGGTLSLLVALLLLSCCRRRTRRAREDTEDTVSDPTSATATMGGAADCTRSWFCCKPREDYIPTPYLVTFSMPTTYNKRGRPVSRPDLASSSTSGLLIEPDRQRQRSGSTEDAESSNMEPRASMTADEIRFLRSTLQDQRINGQTVDVDGTSPPPYSV